MWWREVCVRGLRGGDKVALRPEATASVVRAYINHGMLNLPQPVSCGTWGRCFATTARSRGAIVNSTSRIGVIGSPDAVVDAQLILIATKVFQDLGLKVKVEINSIGTSQTRQEYKVELVRLRRNKEDAVRGLCAPHDAQPLRLLDCKEEGCRAVMKTHRRLWIGWMRSARRTSWSLLSTWMR